MKAQTSLPSEAKQSTNRHEIPHCVRNDGAHGKGKKAFSGGCAAAESPPLFHAAGGSFRAKGEISSVKQGGMPHC